MERVDEERRRQSVWILLWLSVQIVVQVPGAVGRQPRKFLIRYAFAQLHNLLPQREFALRLTLRRAVGARTFPCGSALRLCGIRLSNRHDEPVYLDRRTR